MAAPLRFHGIEVETRRLNEDRRWVDLDVPEVTMRLLTDSGHIRLAPLTEDDLYRVLDSTMDALKKIRRKR